MTDPNAIDVLSRSISWFDNQRKCYAVREVSYKRGDEIDLLIQGTFGRSDSEQSTDFAFVGNRRDDFICDPKDLFDSNGLTDPCRGDTITYTENNVERVFEVVSDGVEPPFRNSDRYGKAIRIHLQQIKETQL